MIPTPKAETRLRQEPAKIPRPTEPQDPMNTRKRLRPLAELIDECLAPALAAQGFAAADIVVGWPEIVGERLAARSEPVKMEWPRRPKHAGPDEPSDPATLVLRCESAFALELQHMAPVLIERVNARYGWRCVGWIVLRQGPVRRIARERKLAELDPAALDAARGRVGGVEDEGLREALVRLGAGIIAGEARTDRRKP